jgi:hypothetical protein
VITSCEFFQLIEAAIFAGVGLALVAITVWRARRL